MDVFLHFRIKKEKSSKTLLLKKIFLKKNIKKLNLEIKKVVLKTIYVLFHHKDLRLQKSITSE